MQPNNKEFEFTGSAGDIFVAFLWTILFSLLGIFGAPLSMKKWGQMVASNIKINGRALSFDVGYLEALKFIFIQTLLVVVTLGIYYFWYIRNTYRFTLEHTSFADTAAANSQVASPVSNTPPAPVTSPLPTGPPTGGPIIQ